MRVKLFVLGYYKCVLDILWDPVDRHIVRVLVALEHCDLMPLVIVGYGSLTGSKRLRRRGFDDHLGLVLHTEDHIAVFEVQKYTHSQYGKQDHQDHYLEYQPELAMTLNLLGFATSLRGTGRRL